jgi:hypothetical protein
MRAICTRTCFGRRRGSFPWSSAGGTGRYVPWLQYLAIVGRRVVETVMLHAMFPRRIHAVTQEGFVIKVLSFVLAHNLGLMAQKMLG